MKILGVTCCQTGIAHTFIAKEKLENAAKELGHSIKVEAQGMAGIEDEITEEDLRDADVVILAHDVKIQNAERFAGIPTVDVPIDMAIKSPKSLLYTVEKKLKEGSK